MWLSWDRDAEAAYLSLLPPEERETGDSRDQVTLEGVSASTGIATLNSIVLDIDRDGRLIGIEFLSPQQTLRASTLRHAE